MSAMSTVWVAPTISAAAALVGIYIGSRGERKRWLRDQRRAAYLDYASAVHAVQREEPNARIQMHGALTAMWLVGPASVVDAADDLTPILRAKPIDLAALTVGYDRFIKA